MTSLHRFFFAHKNQTGGALTLNPVLVITKPDISDP